MCACHRVRCDGLVDTDAAEALTIALAAVVGYIADDGEIVTLAVLPMLLLSKPPPWHPFATLLAKMIW